MNNNKISWSNVDITPLRSIDFSYRDLNKIAERGNVSPDDVQTAINHFARELGCGNERVKMDILSKIIHFRSKPLKQFKKIELEELIKLGQCLRPTPKNDDDEPITIQKSLKNKPAFSMSTDEKLLTQKLYALSQSQLGELLAIFWYGTEIDEIAEFENWERFNKDAENWLLHKPKEVIIGCLLDKGYFSQSICTALNYVV